MKKLFTLIILCSSFTFAQYIKKATFVLTDGKKMDVEDVVYGDKVYEYNYQATKIAIERAANREPKPGDILAAKSTAKHPFA